MENENFFDDMVESLSNMSHGDIDDGVRALQAGLTFLTSLWGFLDGDFTIEELFDHVDNIEYAAIGLGVICGLFIGRDEIADFALNIQAIQPIAHLLKDETES